MIEKEDLKFSPELKARCLKCGKVMKIIDGKTSKCSCGGTEFEAVERKEVITK